MANLKKVGRILLFSAIKIVAVVGVVVMGAWIYPAQPSLLRAEPQLVAADPDRMRDVVKYLSVDCHPRNYQRLDNQAKAVAYISDHFAQTSGTVSLQPFEAAGSTYHNVRCLFDGAGEERLVIGAHYDAHGETPGADDNASGVAGLIELAYMLDRQQLGTDVELVAYCNEEPPFFAGKQMGSYVHAKTLADTEVAVVGMISLEMIGYYSDEPNSQMYPMPLLAIIYPNRGNFIAVVGNLDQREFTKRIKVAMKGTTALSVYSINAPRALPGIDFSDHRNFWEFGHDAVMVTDTAFYRNTEYHKSGDTWDRLNYENMAMVVTAVFNAVNALR